MDFASFLIQTLNSLQYGLLLFLVASGLTLVFGIMGIINLAHGSFYMIGAYLAFVLASIHRQPLRGHRAGHSAGAAVRGLPRMGAVLPTSTSATTWSRCCLTYGLILIFEQCAACWSATTCMAWPSPPVRTPRSRSPTC